MKNELEQDVLQHASRKPKQNKMHLQSQKKERNDITS